MSLLMPPSTPPVEHLVAAARTGDTAALDQLLALYRNYLHLLARTQLDMKLARRLAPSDAVQETLLRALKRFAQFRGETEAELVAWLRRIMARTLADNARHAVSLKRNIGREVALQAGVEQSSQCLARFASQQQPSPSEMADQREQSVLLADALAKLPPVYREVIVLRHFERIEFTEIAARLSRSAGAVRMLWARALERLRKELDRLQ
jgi:RNA polymerase sigma-70 factor (ECF subfamily)